MNYYIIEMDLVDSRNMEQRSVFQQKLYHFLESLSNTYQDTLLFPITIILGDEWRVVCKEGRYLYEIYLKITNFLDQLNLSCYAGFAYGSLEQPLMNCSTLTGDAITSSQKALQYAKSSKNAYQKVVNKNCFVYSIGFRHDEIINLFLQNNALLKQKLTQKQKEVIALYEQYGSYSKMQKSTHLSKSTISERLITANYNLIKQNDEILMQLFQNN